MIRSHFPSKLITELNLENENLPDNIYLILKALLRKRQIDTIVIVDQFNSYSARCRGFNDEVDRLVIKPTLG